MLCYIQSVFGVSGVRMLSGSLYLHYLELEELTCCATVYVWSFWSLQAEPVFWRARMRQGNSLAVSGHPMPPPLPPPPTSDYKMVKGVSK